jgi:serine/threonine protein kinase
VLENVQREAMLLRGVQHMLRSAPPSSLYAVAADHISALLDERVDGASHYLVTEFHPAGDLYRFLLALKDHRLPLDMAREYFRQLCHAVGALHAVGLAHTDLSLENVVIGVDGRARIIDFGTAALHPNAPLIHALQEQGVDVERLKASSPYLMHRSGAQDPRLPFLIEPASVRPGKVKYQGPELYNGLLPWDAMAADCFALGVILYCIILGRPPFHAPDVRDPWWDDIRSGRWKQALTDSSPPHDDASLLPPVAVDFLDRIFQPQAQRLNIYEMLAHPFITKHWTHTS